MISVKDVRKSYGDIEVLKGVSLEVPKGEILAITGASGAGKSTLLHIMATLLNADSGEIVIDGTSLTSLSDRELSRFRNQNIGFVFQFHNLLPEFTALENVTIPALIGGASEKKAKEHALYLLDLMGVGQRCAHKPSELSGGEQQRVAIARALINNPAVLFADEPSGNLDSKTREEIHQLFFRLREELGQTFVIVTHDDNLATLSHRRLVMQDGLIL